MACSPGDAPASDGLSLDLLFELGEVVRVHQDLAVQKNGLALLHSVRDVHLGCGTDLVPPVMLREEVGDLRVLPKPLLGLLGDWSVPVGRVEEFYDGCESHPCALHNRSQERAMQTILPFSSRIRKRVFVFASDLQQEHTNFCSVSPSPMGDGSALEIGSFIYVPIAFCSQNCMCGYGKDVGAEEAEHYLVFPYGAQEPQRR